MSDAMTTVNRSTLRVLAGRLRFLKTIIGLPNLWAVRAFKNVIGTLLQNPHVAELLRFIFLGTIVETSRQVGVKAADFVKHCVFHPSLL